MERRRETRIWKTHQGGRWAKHTSGRIVPTLAVASGKGGTGKSVVAASLAAHFAAQGQRTILFDADLGVGNAHILQNVSPAYTVAHVMSGQIELEEIPIQAPTGVFVIPGGSGVSGLAALDLNQLQLIAQGFTHIEYQHDMIVIDCAAGISEQTLHFLLTAHYVLLVTTPDLTAMTDAYALIKMLHLRDPGIQILLIVNRVHKTLEGLQTAQKIRTVAKRFLGIEVLFLGIIFEDPAVWESVARKTPFLLSHPQANASKQLQNIILKITSHLQRREPSTSFAKKMLQKLHNSSASV